MIKEFILCVACFLYAPLRKRAGAPLSSSPRRGVVIQMAKLGDMVCTTPLFHALKQHYPECTLTVIGNSVNRDLLSGSSDVDEYLEFKGIKDAIGRLRQERYDFGCISAPSAPLLAVFFLGGVRLIVAPRIENGRSPNNTLAYRLLTRLVVTRPHTMHHYAPREYLRLLEPLGIYTDDTSKHLSHTKGARERVDIFLQEKRLRNPGRLLFGLAPSVGNKIKEWFPERFAEVIVQLAKRYPIDVVLIGSSGDKKAAQSVIAYLPRDVSVVDSCGVFSLDEAKAFIASLNLLLSVDTGPVYVAEAFGVPTIDITGPFDEREQPPIGELHLVVTPQEPRQPQLFVMNAREYNLQEVKRQLDSITVPMVVAACETLLPRINGQRRLEDTTRMSDSMIHS